DRVTLHQATHPADWPAQCFDLIVFSEVGYYFEAAAFDDTVARLATTLEPGGCLAACHWRHPFDAARRSAEAVHAALDQALGRPTLCRYEDADFLMQLWAPGPSVAQREQLR
ncbi:SAM-dependent methyltransferase, partial [Xanthomonas sp. Kuri4-2]